MGQLKFLPGIGLFAALFSLAACVQPATLTPPPPLTFLQSPIPVQGLIGSTPAFLNAEFGQPVLRRIDGTSQVWLYHSQVCGLNLILFPDSQGVPRVADAVPDGSDQADCMASLQRIAGLEHPSSS
jgi:hypothetical protein